MFLILDQVCDDVALATALRLVEKFFTIICIAVPIILIVSVAITLGRMVIDPSLEHGISSILKKVVAALLIFFLPTIVDFSIGLLKYANIKNDTFSGVIACFDAARDSGDYVLSHPYVYDNNNKYSFSNIMTKFKKISNSYVNLPTTSGDSSSSTASNDKADGTGGMGIPRYYQGDYADVKLILDKTIATSGCGFTSGAMIASYLTGDTITPRTLIDLARQHYVLGVGMDWSFPNALASQYNLGSVTATESIDAVVNALAHKRPVMCSQSAGIFTSKGHVIVLSGLDSEGNILVNDPNKNNAVTKNFNNTSFTKSEIDASAAQYWIFEAKNEVVSR